MRKHHAFALSISGALFLQITAAAQIAVDTAAARSLGEVVVTGQYGSSNVNQAVQKIRVIDRAQIEAMAAQNLRDVLGNEAGIRLSQDNILGSSLSLQGITGQNIKYLLDGVPMIGRQNGDVDLSQINLNNIERIEIVRGPMSVNYGNNALGGTINLITRKGSRNQRVEGSLTGYAETIGTYNLTGRAGATLGAHRLSLSGGRNFFDGWSPVDRFSLDMSKTPADSGRFKSWKPREQYFADLQYTFSAKSANITLKSAAFSELIVNRGMPRPPYGEAAADDNYRTRRLDQALFVNSTALRGHNLSFQAAYNAYRRVKNTYAVDLTTLEQVPSGNNGDQDTSAFRLLHSRASISSTDTGAVRYEIGYDLNLESGTGLRIRDGRQSIGDYAVFASAEYVALRGLTLRPGLRYAYNTRYASPLTPAINLRYATNAWTLRASYARGFRAPDLKELYFYFVDVNHNIQGNLDLLPERSDNYNLSLDYALRAGEVRIRFESAAFYNDIRDRINLALLTGTSSTYSYVNIGRYKTLGASLGAAIAWKRLSVSAGVICTGFYNELSETVASAPAFSYSPELRMNAGYAFGRGFSTAFFYKYTGAMPGFAMQDNDLLQTRIAAYHIADLSLIKRFGTRYQISCGLKNLFDVTNLRAGLVSGGPAAGAGSQPYSTGRLAFLGATVKLER